MCYHVSTPSKLELEKQLPEYTVQGEVEPYYHVSGFERPLLYVTTNDTPNVIKPAKWKLIPHWVKTDAEAKKYANTLNADSDKIFSSSSYRQYIEKYKGLLWVDGVYEPHTEEGEAETQNYYIYKPEKKIFSLGIVYSPWLNPDTGEIINTFSVLTTPANERFAWIHNEKERMPLIISNKTDRLRWLHANTKEAIKDFFRPSEDNTFMDHRVGRVTAARGKKTNIPETQLPFSSEPPQPTQTSLF